jgi:hypothetical protein
MMNNDVLRLWLSAHRKPEELISEVQTGCVKPIASPSVGSAMGNL